MWRAPPLRGRARIVFGLWRADRAPRPAGAGAGAAAASRSSTSSEIRGVWRDQLGRGRAARLRGRSPAHGLAAPSHGLGADVGSPASRVADYSLRSVDARRRPLPRAALYAG